MDLPVDIGRLLLDYLSHEDIARVAGVSRAGKVITGDIQYYKDHMPADSKSPREEFFLFPDRRTRRIKYIDRVWKQWAFARGVDIVARVLQDRTEHSYQDNSMFILVGADLLDPSLFSNRGLGVAICKSHNRYLYEAWTLGMDRDLFLQTGTDGEYVARLGRMMACIYTTELPRALLGGFVTAPEMLEDPNLRAIVMLAGGALLGLPPKQMLQARANALRALEGKRFIGRSEGRPTDWLDYDQVLSWIDATSVPLAD